MARDGDGSDGSDVLRSKRDATRYQILVGIAERQPAVSQQEIADAVGVTAQAVSDYLRDLREQGRVEKHGRGRYEVTEAGIDWLTSRTDELRGVVEHVADDVVGRVGVETAVATTEIEEGEPVSLTMRDGVLRATAGDAGSTTAVAVTGASAGRDVGVANADGAVQCDPGRVTAVPIPDVRDGGSGAVDPSRLLELAGSHDLIAAAGAEALAAARAADLDPDVRFGTAVAVGEAAAKGVDVLLLAAADRLSAHTDELRERGVGYEVVDADADATATEG